MSSNGYVHPEVLVETDWVAQHLKDPKVRIIESNEDLLLYDVGHIPGAVKIDWQGDLQDSVTATRLPTPRSLGCISPLTLPKRLV